MQCGGIWGTRLDPQVSLGAGLGGAVLVVSPRGMRRKGPGKTSPSQLFWTKKWPYGPLFNFHTVAMRRSEYVSLGNWHLFESDVHAHARIVENFLLPQGNN